MMNYSSFRTQTKNIISFNASFRCLVWHCVQKDTHGMSTLMYLLMQY